MLGNAIIGFSGALASIQNGGASVDNHVEFIFIALGGYALGVFLIKLLSKTKMQEYIKKDNKPTAPIWYRGLHFLIDKLNYNDEHPTKLFATFLLFIFSSALINIIFRTVEIEVGENYNYFFKAFFLFLFIWASVISDKISKRS